MVPEYVSVTRKAKYGELVLCRISGLVWRVVHPFENGNVIIGQERIPLYSDTPDLDTLKRDEYTVLEKVDYPMDIPIGYLTSKEYYESDWEEEIYVQHIRENLPSKWFEC